MPKMLTRKRERGATTRPPLGFVETIGVPLRSAIPRGLSNLPIRLPLRFTEHTINEKPLAILPRVMLKKVKF